MRTDTLGEFFDVASLLANQPLPAGRRVAILTNGGGPGILAADACDADGLVVPPLPAEVRDALAEFLPPEAALEQSRSTRSKRTPESFRRAIGILAGWEGIDAIIVLFVPPLVTKSEDVAAADPRCRARASAADPRAHGVHVGRGRAARAPRGSACACPRTASRRRRPARSLTPSGTPSGVLRRAGACRSSRTSGRTRRRRCWRRPSRRIDPAAIDQREPEPGGIVDRRGSGRRRARAGCDQTRSPDCSSATASRPRAGAWRTPPRRRGRGADEIGGPVALKAVATGVVHKAEARAVVLSLEGAAAVEVAADGMAATSPPRAIRWSASSSSGWCPAASRCSSAWCTTGCSVPSSRAAPAARRSSCCGTWPCGSRR